jgi:hypothetical protein
MLPFAIDGDKRFIKEPDITTTPFSMPNFVGKLLTGNRKMNSEKFHH